MKAAKQPNQTPERTRRGPFIQRKACCSADQENTPFISPSRTGNIQPKLAISQPGDQYEREADQMAERVMRMPMPNASAPAISRMPATQPRLQRLCAECEDQIQRKPTDDLESEEEKLSQGMPRTSEKIVQRQATGTTTSHASTDLSNRLHRRRGRGETLPPNTQAHMENAFGTDFSAVRIHRDSEAVQMNRELNAQAFTHRSDVYFNQGKYDPGSSQGRRLLGHELTHVVQQRKVDLLLQRRQSERQILDITRRIPDQDLLYEQMAHQFAYDGIQSDSDRELLRRWGYQDEGLETGNAGFKMIAFRPLVSSERTQRPFPTRQRQQSAARRRGVIAFAGTDPSSMHEFFQDLPSDLEQEGIGMFQWASNEWRIRNKVEQLAALHNTDRRVDVIGHSLGGALAQLTAAYLPNFIGRVVTFASPGISSDVIWSNRPGHSS